MLRELYVKGWAVERVLVDVVKRRELTADFASRWGKWLVEAVEDPDALWRRNPPQELLDELVWKNLILYNMYDREPHFRVDTPPEKDLELGVGRNIAWQTPIHREAVRRALKEAGLS